MASSNDKPPAAGPAIPLATATALGIGWLLFQAVGGRVVGFLSQIFLARILAPADFGMIGLALTVTSIIGLLVTFGIDDVLLQRQRTFRFWAKPAFVTGMALSSSAFLLVCAVTPLAAWAYGAPELKLMLPILALAMPIGALSLVSSVKLRAELKFGTVAKIALAEQIALQLLTIYFALTGWGALSFAIPAPIVTLGRTLVLLYLSRPSFRPARRVQYRRMLGQGGAVFFSRLITTGVHQGDYVVLGLLATPAVVGTYFFAFRLAVQPIHMLAGSFQGVLFPAMAQLEGQPNRQRAAALHASKLLACAVMPYCFLQAAIAAPAVDLVFGPKWHSAIPLIQILSIGLAFDAVSWLAGALLSARGEFVRALRYSMIFSPLFFVAVIIGGLAGSATGVAIAVSGYYLLLAPLYSYVVYRTIGIGVRETASIYLVPAASAGLAMAGAVISTSAVGAADNSLASLALIPLIGLPIYALLLRVFAPSLLTELVERIRTLARTRKGVSPA